ncbi:MAG TPA: TonB family protein [Terriglobales bacterium]|nr:TonB family protein [Terriglobales bacterium]
MPTTESNLEISSGPIRMGPEQRQRRRMLIALGLLVIALGVLLFKDREFYFSSNQSDSDSVESSPTKVTPESAMAATAAPATTTAPATATPEPAATTTAPAATTTAPTPTMTAPAATKPLTQAAPVSKPAAPPSVAAKPKKAKSQMSHPAHAAPPHVAQAAPPHVAQAAPVQMAQAAPAEESSQASADGPVVTTTNRTILYPLEVEVQAGNQHRPVSTVNNSVKVDMQSTASAAFAGKTPAVEAQPAPAITESAEARVSLSPGTAERVTKSVKPDYPVLAKQMKVQGAVVLDAEIDRTGNIQQLQVLSGPSILATAAREAVRQWRFKPYYEHGQPVETEARITVNFTISTY